jgi:phospholipid/cholesterol/gamma-HCH transport system ATP-binding protein
MAAPFLEIRGVKKSFGAHQVLTGIDLQAERGSITTIMGKSGIGKSVLLKCIAGIYSPDAGEILIDGKPGVGARSRSPDAPRLSYLFQGNALFDSLTAMENVALPLLETTKTARRASRSWRCSNSWTWATWPTSIPARCPAACKSAWRWRGP